MQISRRSKYGHELPRTMSKIGFDRHHIFGICWETRVPGHEAWVWLYLYITLIPFVTWRLIVALDIDPYET